MMDVTDRALTADPVLCGMYRAQAARGDAARLARAVEIAGLINGPRSRVRVGRSTALARLAGLVRFGREGGALASRWRRGSLTAAR